MEYGEAESRSTERAYLSPNIVQQRKKTVELLDPRPGDRIVDVGCGPGLLAVELAAAVGERGAVIAVDPSAAMIKLANDRCQNLPQIDVYKGSATDLDMQNGVADGATCTQVLLYVDDVFKALGEIHRILRPGGTMVVLETDWRSTVLHSRDEALTERVIASWDAAVPSPRLPARLEKLLHQVGFADIQVEAFPILCRSGDPDDFALSMLQQFADSACEQGVVSAEQSEQWVNDLISLGRANEFFSCVNRFLFRAIKA